jgi:peptidoglycan hydrolase-like protein with peptidoglycan-binding domain
MNRSESSTYDATPVQETGALVNMVVAVCQNHAATPVETVVNAVFRSLSKAKLSVASPEITVTAGKQLTVIRQATLKQMQEFLVSIKYMPMSEANGKFGPDTKAALVKFQIAQHLPQSGLPDPATVLRALIEMH